MQKKSLTQNNFGLENKKKNWLGKNKLFCRVGAKTGVGRVIGNEQIFFYALLITIVYQAFSDDVSHLQFNTKENKAIYKCAWYLNLRNPLGQTVFKNEIFRSSVGKRKIMFGVRLC